MEKKISRRKFIGTAAAAAAVMSVKHSSITQAADSSKPEFKLKYAPHFGMFRHHAGNDLI
ncbi:MAG: twin-arginine translocation signal domain-containing protein, partial [Planctomycetota bacterium]